ncbi:MAG TPA: cytochrome b/b6 domain-containing protein [Vicinamibacteria bacterium]|nr:cytochrome b/b6 domain-containing protein [Vicinamibacteria bacterium]
MNATEAWVGESRYVYQLPLRLVHWIIFLDLIVLSISGYWIGSGDLPAGPGGEFQMGTIRYVHTLAGWVLFAALLLRIYLFFFGNVYARWTDFIPHRREHWRDVKEVLLFYTFIRRGYPHAEYGHNRLASLTYLVVYLLILFMVVSGLALHGMAFPAGWQGWLTWPLAFVTAPTLRLLHHLGMWLLWGFAVHHLASVFLADNQQRGGLVGGIFSGYKLVPKRVKR